MTAALFNSAVLRTEVRLFRREPGNLFWILFFPSLLLGILGAVPAFRDPDPNLGGLRSIDLYVPVAVLLGVLIAGLQGMPQTLTGYREQGILRRMATTPVRATALLSAQMLVYGGSALVSALLALTLGRVVYGVSLPEQPAGYLLALLLAAFACLAFGALICSLSRTTKIAAAFGSAALFPAMFCAGVWLPVQAMPDLLARIVGWTPFGAASEALNDAAAGAWPGWDHLGVTAGWTVLLTAFAARWFRWE
ncbi:ABC transporter permease [Streptomyces sp. NPDC029526]|uniref:ABC transporter permease n=1 Tax=Streptomyces sp. NPDC029526 TaxID=3155728 RepID=UPI0033DAA2DB